MGKESVERTNRQKNGKGLIKKLILCMCLLVTIVMPTWYSNCNNVVNAKGYSSVKDFTGKNNFDYLESVDTVGRTTVQDGYIITRNIGIGIMLLGLLCVAITLFFARSPQKREEKKTTIVICVIAAVIFFAAGSFLTLSSKVADGIGSSVTEEATPTKAP